MKFIHLSDLHIGKRVNEFSMLEDQEHILNQILRIIGEEAPDAVLIAGDVYDKSIPSTEAVGLLDRFLYRLSECGAEVFLISGNHDSSERLSFGSRLIDRSGVHISPVYRGKVQPFTVKGVNIWLLPFLKPAHVRPYFADEEIASYNDAMKAVIRSMQIDPAQRNVLVTHQFVTGSERTESEEVSVGGADNIDAEVFAGFDYVALGHLHRPQNCGCERIRYCGSPLKYSFSEAGDEKSVTVGELAENGDLTIRTVPLTPLHEMVEIRGTYDELASKSFYDGTTYGEDYVRVTLTDEDDIPDAIGRLRTIYHNLMKLRYDNRRTRAGEEQLPEAQVERKSPLELFEDLYRAQNGQELTEEQRKYMIKMIESVWEDGNETD